LPTGLVNESCKAVEIIIGEIRRRFVQQGCNGLVWGALKEGAQQMAKGAASSRLAFDSGAVDVARSVLLVGDMTFFLQDAEVGADGGIAGRVHEGIPNVGGTGGTETMERIEDFTLATAEAWWEHGDADVVVLKG